MLLPAVFECLGRVRQVTILVGPFLSVQATPIQEATTRSNKEGPFVSAQERLQVVPLGLRGMFIHCSLTDSLVFFHERLL